MGPFCLEMSVLAPLSGSPARVGTAHFPLNLSVKDLINQTETIPRVASVCSLPVCPDIPSANIVWSNEAANLISTLHYG